MDYYVLAIRPQRTVKVRFRACIEESMTEALGIDPMSEKLKKVEELSHLIGSCSHRMREHIRKGRASRNTAAWRKDYRLMQAHSLELAQFLHDLRLLP
jgi:hypothetical protein